MCLQVAGHLQMTFDHGCDPARHGLEFRVSAARCVGSHQCQRILMSVHLPIDIFLIERGALLLPQLVQILLLVGGQGRVRHHSRAGLARSRLDLSGGVRVRLDHLLGEGLDLR